MGRRHAQPTNAAENSLTDGNARLSWLSLRYAACMLLANDVKVTELSRIYLPEKYTNQHKIQIRMPVIPATVFFGACLIKALVEHLLAKSNLARSTVHARLSAGDVDGAFATTVVGAHVHVDLV